MDAPSQTRDEQRAASEAAILESAWELFARRGPDGASLRDVGDAAGCTHALVARYYGSKDGLVDAVATRMGDRVDHVVRRSIEADDPLLELLHLARTHRSCQQLLVRSALGDLPPREFPACLHVDSLLALTPIAASVAAVGPDRRSRLCAYAAASLLAGFVTCEGFLVAGTGLEELPPDGRDAAVAQAARRLLDVAGQSEPRLHPRDLSTTPVPESADRSRPPSSRDALLWSAVELFARRGPASISVRDIARHAGANQGLIYRHFGSKEALLAEAIEDGSTMLATAANAADGFDFDAMAWLMRHVSPAPRLIARTLVDDIDITSVRRTFPVLGRLLDTFDQIPQGAGPADLSNPRVAVMTAAALGLGSAIWGDHLGAALGLGERDGVDAAVADLARYLATDPFVATTDHRGR